MAFLNQRAFDDPQSWMRSEGANVDREAAVVSVNGKVLFYPRTGGMMEPKRHELEPGTKLFRFGASRDPVEKIVTGPWWVEQPEFRKLLSFAQQHDLSIGMAVRALCLVPPQWSDMGRLVRVEVRRPLLAMRGLGQSVAVDPGDGQGTVRLPHLNDNPARRLHQLFIPGLREPGAAQTAFVFGNVYNLDPEASLRGWIYL